MENDQIGTWVLAAHGPEIGRLDQTGLVDLSSLELRFPVGGANLSCSFWWTSV